MDPAQRVAAGDLQFRFGPRVLRLPCGSRAPSHDHHALELLGFYGDLLEGENGSLEDDFPLQGPPNNEGLLLITQKRLQLYKGCP